MKGVVLAGGTGTRLYPATMACSKQIIPIYDKPMIYYSLAVLMLLGLRDILIISTRKDMPMFKDLLKTGEQFGVHFSYVVQDRPRGIADAFIVGRDFIGSDRVCLILGDNLFYGPHFEASLKKAANFKDGAVVFGHFVKNPRDFGVVEFNSSGTVISIEEKPKNPKSNFAVPGLYFYDNDVVEIVNKIKYSNRGELEITAVNEVYLKRGQLKVEILKDGVAWFDTGTHNELLSACNFVQAVQTRQRVYVGCLEEIAYKNGFITKEQLLKLAEPMLKTDYGQHLIYICEKY